MNRNSSVNNIIMTWWCDSAAFLFCVFAITMALPFYPVTSHAEEGEQDYWHYKTNKYGFFTRYPLYIVADTDNSSSGEDIIFGFDAQEPSDAKEKMRLTDEGRLGIGTYVPAGTIDVRVRSPYRSISEAQVTTGTDIDETLALFGAVRPYKITDGVTKNYSVSEYYGLKLNVEGQRQSSLQEMSTTVGFDLLTTAIVLSFSENADAEDRRLLPDLTDRSGDFTNREHRALTMGLDDSGMVKTAIGHPAIYSPTEALDVNGAIRIGDSSHTNAGTLRYNDGNFEGYNGSEWLGLGAGSGSDDIMLGGEHQLIFGRTDDHRTPNNFIVNSQNVPSDDAAEFPIPETGSSYNNDDEGTSGGMSLVAGGLPRFTVKGNGNTYVHKRLSIGVGGHVTDTVLTVAGAVHIGPDNVEPTEFDYGDAIGNYLLWVEKGIVSEDFAIANVDNWSDHVLQNDYDLKPLSEVESFIEQEGHLPGVPSAEDVKDNGYTVHEMTRTLLGKVEELTLHTIAQQKALEEQKAEIAQLRAQLSGVQPVKHATSFQVKTGF